jgi:hypothetical protein
MKKSLNFTVTGRIIDHIGLAMYSSLPKAISELVANSYDNDAQNVYITIPKQIEKSNLITIKDDGNGMTLNFIRNNYMKIGLNYRKFRDKSPKFKRSLIGSKGIGKFAGLGIAEIMEIETINSGKKCKFRINRRMFNDENSIESVSIPVTEENCSQANGTVVCLKELLPHVLTMEDEELRRFFIREFGFKKNFHIYVNGEEISGEDIPGEKRNIKENIEGCGQVLGYIIIARQPKDIKKAGIITTVRGKRVLGPTLFEINSRGHQYRVAERIFGEIEATFLDPENLENKLDGFIISTSRDGFNQSHPKYIKYKEWIENKLIEISRRLEKEQTEKRKKKFLESKEFGELLLRLPKEMRKEVESKVKSFIEDLAPKLNELPEKEADIILQSMRKIIEAGEMITILEKIEQASKEDIKRLSETLQNWGLYEINVVIEHFKSRLTVISKFEQLIEKIETLEYPDIHKLFEKNLWLLNDEYRLFASNKQLKTILEKEIQTSAKKHAKERPDLIIKSFGDKLVIIELKRPSHKIGAEDYTQIKKYKTIIKKHSPNITQIECYLIGNSFDETIRDPEDAKIGVYLKSFSEILQLAKEKYKELLSKLSGGET